MGGGDWGMESSPFSFEGKERSVESCWRSCTLVLYSPNVYQSKICQSLIDYFSNYGYHFVAYMEWISRVWSGCWPAGIGLPCEKHTQREIWKVHTGLCAMFVYVLPAVHSLLLLPHTKIGWSIFCNMIWHTDIVSAAPKKKDSYFAPRDYDIAATASGTGFVYLARHHWFVHPC